MNGKQYFLGALYNSDCNFSSPFDFFPHVVNNFDGIPYEKQSVVERLDQLLEKLKSNINYPLKQNDALNFLISNDLEKIKIILESVNFKAVEDELHDAYSRYLVLLHNAGFEFEEPQLYIVEKLPNPYQDMSWFAFAADVQDEKKYGIKKGLYFLRQHLRPNYSAIMLAHEMIHKVFSDADAVYYARGLEEGIANVLGIFYLAANVFGANTAKRYFRYMHLSDGLQKSSELYYEYTRQAAYLANKYGTEGVISLVKAGRKEIKRVEMSLMQGDFQNIDMIQGNHNHDVEQNLAHLTFGYVRNLVVSPLAYYLIDHIEQWDSIEHIAHKANSDIEASKIALKELQTQLSLIILSDNIVSNSDLDIVRNVIRYKATFSN